MGSTRRRPTRASTPAVPPAPVVDVDPALPTLGRSRLRGVNSDFYLLCRPGRLVIRPHGGSSSIFTRVLIAVAWLIPVGFFIGYLVQTLSRDTTWWLPAVLAAVITAVVGGGISAVPVFGLAGYLDTSRERRRAQVVARVTRKNELGWQLCETVQGVVACRSWADRTVDPQRRIPVLLWTAVQRSIEVETQRDAVYRARSHPSLDDLARAAAAKATREHAALASVALNLRTIRDAAEHVDRTRSQRAQQQRTARDKQLEERQLRSTLLGTVTSAAPDHSDNRADAAAGLAAQAETIAALLADTDRLLHT